MDYNELNGILNNLEFKHINVNKLEKESSFKLKDDINTRINNYKQGFGEINNIQTKTENKLLPNHADFLDNNLKVKEQNKFNDILYNRNMNKVENNNFSSEPLSKEKMIDKDQSINNKLFDRNLMFANTNPNLVYNNHNDNLLQNHNSDIQENDMNDKLSQRNSVFNRKNEMPIYDNLPIMSRINTKNKYKNN